MKLPGVETNSRGVHCFGDDNQLPRYTRAETRRSYRQKYVRKSRYSTSVIFNKIMIWIICILYVLIGILVCNKIDMLNGSDNVLDLVVDSVMIAFWPLTVLFHLLDL